MLISVPSLRFPVIAAACLALLSGCGGGSSSDTAAAPTQSAALAGTVAVGAPMLNATVTVMDANGVTRSAAAAADGSYSGLSVDGLTAPFRLQACGLVDGQQACYYAVVSQAGTANVTPLTHAAVSLALGADAGAMFGANGSAPSDTALAAKKQSLLDALAPVLTALGLGTDVDFTSTAFNADRTGMDKLLDAVKVTTGTDAGSGNQATSFVQVEGKIGSGNVFLGSDGSNTGSLSAGTGLGVDLRSISTVFQRLSTAIGSASETACATSMSDAGIFDAAFSLNIDGNLSVTASTAPTAICHLAAQNSLLGGVFANPVMRDCDFSGADKVCNVGFDIVKNDVVFDGAELAVVLRNGSTAWQLLGRDSPYEIHVGAAVQRTVRVDVADSAPSYTRALSFDVSDGDGTVHAARVYPHDTSGTAWDTTPIAMLDDQGCAGLGRLTIQGSSCGSSWVSLDNWGAADLSSGDALIDAFYKRGRQVKVELYADVAATQLVATVVKRIDGVPPKSAVLASVPWLELDAATKAALVSYDGSGATFTAAWGANTAVSAKDITFCLAGNCSGDTRAAHEEVSGSHDGSSETLTLSVKPAGASAYKQISLYGRDREQMGVSTNYVSCGGAVSCF